MKTQLTSQQSDAVNILSPGGVLLEAGAGSGKTHVIVERYLKSLFRHISERAMSRNIDSPVAAITFTEKAAKELRDRIQGRIDQLIGDQDFADIASRNILQRFSENPELLNVSTIHGFCKRELWRNKLILALGPELTLMDEFESSLLRENAVRMLHFSEYGEVPDLGEFKNREILGKLQSFHLNPELYEMTEQDWFNSVQLRRLDLLRDKILKKIPYWKDECQSLSRFLKPGSSADKYLLALLEWFALLESSSFENQQSLEDIPEFPGFKMRLVLAKSEGEQKEAGVQLKLIADEIKVLLNLLGSDSDFEKKSVTKIKKMLSFYKRYEDNYRNLKNSSELFDFDDLETEMLSALESRNFRDSIKKKFSEILVDEFQDTSARQFQILSKIAGSDLKGLYFVGDSKQSIYGFRGADLRVYNQTKNICSDTLALDLSFRSTPAIIEYVNSLFDGIFPSEITEQNIYEASMQKLRTFREKGEFEPVRLVVPETTIDKPKIDDIKKAEANSMLSHCRDLLESGVEPSDICILLGKLKDNEVYFDTLRAGGIPVTVFSSSVKENLFSETVKALIRFTYNQRNSVSRSVLTLSPLLTGVYDAPFSFESMWLEEFRRRYFSSARERLSEIILDLFLRAENFQHRLIDWRLISKINEWEDKGLGPASIVENMERMKKRSLPLAASSQLSPGEGVKIMTVHGSKGLEFSNVILGGLYQARKSDSSGFSVGAPLPGLKWKSGLWENLPSFDHRLHEIDSYPIEIAEKKRLLYVALTRAVDRLFIFLPSGKLNCSALWANWIVDHYEQNSSDLQGVLQFISEKN